MKAFNATLPIGSVVVAIDHKYNENDGAYSVAWVWDGETLSHESYANGYNNRSFEDAEVDATFLQISQAAEAYAVGKFDLGRSHFNQYNTFIGCTVKLARSRKAPNKVELLVVDHADAYYDDNYNRRIDAQSAVMVEGVKVWVSQSCINEVVKGDYPWWAPKA